MIIVQLKDTKNKTSHGGNIHIIYISDIHNSGVSHAYNIGWELAQKMQKQWVLLLDQDTSFPIDSIKKYREQIELGRLLCAPLLVLNNGFFSSPCNYKWGIGRPTKNIQTGLLDLHNKSILNSGLLINLDIFQKIGGYNENIPLDFSDHEWFERVRLHYKTIYIMDLICKHNLSVIETDVTKVLNRFKYYLKGAKEYQKNKAPRGLSFIVFLRTIKLSFKFKTLNFLRYYFNQ